MPEQLQCYQMNYGTMTQKRNWIFKKLTNNEIDWVFGKNLTKLYAVGTVCDIFQGHKIPHYVRCAVNSESHYVNGDLGLLMME